MRTFTSFPTGQFTCESLIEQDGPRVCTDVRMPNHAVSLECPLTCAKANGALAIEQRPTDHQCFQTCATLDPTTCQDWRDRTFRVGGCAVSCTPALKLLYRPDLQCKHSIAAGDRVELESGRRGCVESVLSPSAIVKVGGNSQAVKVESLLLAQSGPCATPLTAEAAPFSSLQAVINGPTQVSAKSCEPVTLDAYQSTNSGPASLLSYQWQLPALPALDKGEFDLQSPTLSFRHLSPATYTFGLTASNGTHRVQATEFKMVVVQDSIPLVTLACPKSVCIHAQPDEYKIHVDLYDQTVLMLDVGLASECDAFRLTSGENSLPIEWKQSESAANEQWKPLQVRRDIYCSCYLLRVFRF